MSSTDHLVRKPFSAYMPIAVTCMVMALVPGALVTSCMSIFFPMISEDYGVPTSSITVYMTFGVILMALVGPAIGRACQKVDLRIVGACLTGCVTLCYLSLSMSASVIQVVATASIMMPCAMLGIGMFNPTLINRWFKDRAGALMGFAAAFTGVGGVIFLQIDQLVIDHFDYRAAFLANALFVLVITLPCVVFLIRDKPSDKGMLPYVNTKEGELADNDQAALARAAAKNWSVEPKVATKSAAFWLLCAVIALTNAAVMIAQFFPTYVNSLADKGVVAFVTGTGLATFTMAGQAVCKFLLGAGSDFSPSKTVLASAGVGVVAVLLVWLCPTTPLLPVGGFIFGMFYASPIVLMPLVAGAIFGTGENFSVIWGRTMLPSGLLGAPAGTIWPLISENLGGFDAVFVCGIVCIVVVAVLAFLAMRLGKRLPHAEGVIPAAQKMAEEARCE